MKNSLFIIDAQNDFCCPNGSLYVPGAEKDCQRLATFILNNKSAIDALFITLDTHPVWHIAHPFYWKDKKGNNPPVYTCITYQDFKNEHWQPVDKSKNAHVEYYLLQLEKKAKYNLIIWPPHCLRASWGASVNEDILKVAQEWEVTHNGKNITYLQKAANPDTEHYSALQAEVPDPADPSTSLNQSLIDHLAKSEYIYIAGEAFSHCVSNTIRDLAYHLPMEKIILLKDCTSNVAGFEKNGEAFYKEFISKGMKTAYSTEYI